MESEIGKVVSTGPGVARVQVTQSGICNHCELESSCMHDTGGKRVIEARDPLGVSVDQHVKIELGGGELVAASFLAYMVPLATLFVGALLGFHLARGSRPELWTGLGALGGLGIGVVVSRMAGDWFGRRGKMVPIITEVVAVNGKE